jgi:hypothetical protein
MPKIGTNAVPGEALNHTFAFISPADTIVPGDPNSCNGCHSDKTPRWALDNVEKLRSAMARLTVYSTANERPTAD